MASAKSSTAAIVKRKTKCERARLERRIVSLENLRAFALPVIDRLAALPERATWGEWITALTESGRLHPARAGARHGAAGRARAHVARSVPWAWRKCCW